jgi:hypothetical protein
MAFKHLSLHDMEKVVSALVQDEVVYQDRDSHAIYFNGDNGTEYKVVLDQEEELLYEREMGEEDWNPCFDVELTEEAMEQYL